jgi:hypothetical protein
MKTLRKKVLTVILIGIISVICLSDSALVSTPGSSSHQNELPYTPRYLEEQSKAVQITTLVLPAAYTKRPDIKAMGSRPETENKTPTPLRVPRVTAHTQCDTESATQNRAKDWREEPVIPNSVSCSMKQLFSKGLREGRDPHRFSKLGDCQNICLYFLCQFDDPQMYDLGEYIELQETIDWYKQSFGRDSEAVRGGLNSSAMLSHFFSNKEVCEASEGPAQCELRLYNSSVALISLEEAWNGDVAQFESGLRLLIEYVLDQNVVPILATKADNHEGDHAINELIVELASEYQVPLWNFWKAVQGLPNGGLSEDGFHLTYLGPEYNFADPYYLKTGWGMRNLSALQVLDTVRRELNED